MNCSNCSAEMKRSRYSTILVASITEYTCPNCNNKMAKSVTHNWAVALVSLLGIGCFFYALSVFGVSVEAVPGIGIFIVLLIYGVVLPMWWLRGKRRQWGYPSYWLSYFPPEASRRGGRYGEVKAIALVILLIVAGGAYVWAISDWRDKMIVSYGDEFVASGQCEYRGPHNAYNLYCTDYATSMIEKRVPTGVGWQLISVGGFMVIFFLGLVGFGTLLFGWRKPRMSGNSWRVLSPSETSTFPHLRRSF